jgi:aspartyl protease family protein
MSDQAPNLIYLVLLLVFVGSALVGRQLPLGKSLKMALAWAAIFGIVFMVLAFRNDFSALGQRLLAEATGAPIVEGKTVRIGIAEDGHYWVNGAINGQEVRFLVDSGASITTVSRQVAGSTGLDVGMRAEMVETANGIVQMRKSRADSLRVGPIEREKIGVNVNPQGNVNVLGMNFLSSLRSWRVQGRVLVLES